MRPPIHGHCVPAFAKVGEAFAASFNGDAQIGACVAIVLDGAPVVDLWGGWRDPAREHASWCSIHSQVGNPGSSSAFSPSPSRSRASSTVASRQRRWKIRSTISPRLSSSVSAPSAFRTSRRSPRFFIQERKWDVRLDVIANNDGFSLRYTHPK